MEWPAYIDGVTVSAFEHAPMRVFVVWHPKFAGGMALFRELHQWLGGPGRNLYRRGLGVPVHAWTSSSSDDPPPPVPLAWQSVTVVVAIVDGELAGRRRWRDWFERLAKVNDGAVSPVIILPWAIHPAAAHLTGIGLLHLLGSEECEPRQLCRRVTEACAIRLMDPKATQPLQIFLSYARRDGAPVALEVRRALQAYGHLSVFLDDHDLQPGAAWRTSLDSEIERGAALFAIVTDLYAGRAWCREELRRFREPRRESVDCHRWWLRPVFILEHLSGAATRSMLEVGNAPIARWDPARATEVVDEFLREILFSEVNRARARLVNADASVQVIHWIPDTWTLLQVLSRAGPVKQIAYPGDGLPGIEVERLGQLFPGVTLTSFEEFSRKAVPRRSASAPRPPILVSISEPPPEQLVRLGLASEHLDDFTVRLARMLLYEGFDVMYGGRPRTGFTDSFQDDSGTVVMEARFINFLGWPFSGDLGASQIADTFGVTRYVRIRWKGERSASRADPGPWPRPRVRRDGAS